MKRLIAKYPGSYDEYEKAQLELLRRNEGDTKEDTEDAKEDTEDGTKDDAKKDTEEEIKEQVQNTASSLEK
jgi:hypothetical protein